MRRRVPPRSQRHAHAPRAARSRAARATAARSIQTAVSGAGTGCPADFAHRFLT
ncbi:hypothetical protein MYA_0738 [Burkholderia sp. KJ006]|nr:hypothetical protein MYA_0738 [Burkholderia sp. KJ006]